MKVALIWPKTYDPNYVIPLSLGYLKSNLDNNKHDIRIFDCALENIDADSKKLKNFLKEFNPHVVGVSCWSMAYYEGIRILKTAKSINEDIITVVGGVHVTTCPDQVIKEEIVDFAFWGEAEASFPKFIEQIESSNPDFSKIPGLVYISSDGTIVKNEIALENNLDKIKIPDYDAINLMGYIKKGYRFNTTYKLNAPVWVTRGCPYGCAFCSASLMNGRVVRTHSIQYMIKWIKYLYYRKGIRHINIIDDNFTFHVNYAKQFCKAVIDLNLKDLHFGTPNGIRIERIDSELLHLMKHARWENIVVAPESGSKKTLERMRKKIDPDIIPEKVKEIKKAGFKVHGFFIIGYPGETEDDIKKTVKLLRKCKFNFFFLNNFQPLPGTLVYNELVEKNEIVDGLLPKDYSGGERIYFPKALKHFNFPGLVLREYIYLALSNPLNIPYMFKIINPKIIAKKVGLNLKGMLKSMIRIQSYK